MKGKADPTVPRPVISGIVGFTTAGMSGEKSQSIAYQRSDWLHGTGDNDVLGRVDESITYGKGVCLSSRD